MNLPYIHAADAAAHNDIAPLDLSTANHTTDFNIASRFDRKPALHISFYFNAAGKVYIACADINAGIDKQMGINDDLSSLLDHLTVNGSNQFMLIDHFGILPLWHGDGLSRLWRNFFTQYILAGNPFGLRDANGKNITDLGANKDIHIFIIHAIKCTGGGAPFAFHIELLLNPRICPRLWRFSLRNNKGSKLIQSIVYGIRINAINNMFCRKGLFDLRNRWHNAILLLIKTNRCGHLISGNINRKWNPWFCFHFLQRNCIQLRFYPITFTNKYSNLQFIIICNPCIFQLLFQCRKFNVTTIPICWINGKIISIVSD